jgi:hypothetical protein
MGDFIKARTVSGVIILQAPVKRIFYKFYMLVYIELALDY